MSTPSTPDSVAPELVAVGKAIWWMVLIRGVAAIVFGILALVIPTEITVVALAYVFAVYSIFDGVAQIAHAVRVRARAPRWGWLLVAGILSVVAGVLAAIFPVLTGFAGLLLVIYFIALWSILTGIAGFPAAHAMTDGGRKVWAYVFAALAVLFGIALVVAGWISPPDAVQALVWTIGAYAIISGIMLLVIAFGVRSVARRVLDSTR